ncbi:MAG: hypothetical protein QXJ14_02530 [Candidatus Aenigmatarchaeota archaeon]
MSEKPIDELIEKEIEEWKKKYLAKGLPLTLLEELAQEAKREWEIELGFRELRLYYDLIVNVEDDEYSEENYYKYVISHEHDVLRGYITNTLTQTFKQLPAEKLHIQVYKLDKEKNILGYGYEDIILSSDKIVTIKIKKIELAEKVFMFENVFMYYVNEFSKFAFCIFIDKIPEREIELKPSFDFGFLLLAKKQDLKIIFQ